METYFQLRKIYLDTCCLIRTFDDQTQVRIQHETESIVGIISHFQAGHWLWISSGILTFEVNQTFDSTQRDDINDILNYVHQTVHIGTAEKARGKTLEVLGFKAADALHIACAESGKADVLLTTDDRMLRQSKRRLTQLHVRVENPHIWFQEVTESDK